MAVEKVGQSDESKRRVTCKNCGAVLEFLPKDVQYMSLSCMGESAGGYDYIVCPDCESQVETKGSKPVSPKPKKAKK